MDDLFLNFPTFYHSAIKSNTSFPQFNAVSVLLLGDIRDNCIEESIDDPSVSGYVSGKKPIRKSILTLLLNISHEEAVRRLRMLGIQDIQRMVDALTILIGEVSNLSSTAKTPLLTLAKTVGAEYDFVAEVFLAAIKCPSTFTLHLSKEMIQYLHSLGSTKQPTSIPNSSDSSEVLQEIASNSKGISEPAIHEENVQEPIIFSQEAKEVSVSYRNLSILEDREAAISYFLNACSNPFDLAMYNYEDVVSIISEAEGFCYSMAELRGTAQSITFEFSRWEKLPKCIGCITALEMPLNIGLDDADEIISSIKNLIHENANYIWGIKLSPEFRTDQVRVCTLFQMQDVLLESAPAEKGGDLYPDELHNRTEKEPEDDPFDEIFRIFSKKS